MTWFVIDDTFAFHPKVVAAGNAITLWVRAGAWCAQQLTDGHVPSHMIPTLGTKRDAGKLVEVGLWERVEDGYVFHDWSSYQQSREEVERKRRQNADRVAKWRKRQQTQGVTPDEDVKPSARNASRNGVRNALRTPLVTPPPTQTHTTNLPTVGSGDRCAPPADTLNLDVPSPDPEPAEVHAGTVVAAWTDACIANDVRPTAAQRAQVGRLARELLNDGNDPTRVLAAAAQAGARGYVTIDRELTVMAGRAPSPAAAQLDPLLAEARRTGGVALRRDADPGRPACPSHPEFSADACPECEDTP